MKTKCIICGVEIYRSGDCDKNICFFCRYADRIDEFDFMELEWDFKDLGISQGDYYEQVKG